MIIGIAGTTTIHLSKGLMRLGLSRIQDPAVPKKSAYTVYTVGILMNFTNPLWVILANRFAPTVYYTSMYGLGLLALALFSDRVLHEKLRISQYFGILIIVTGTLMVGIGNLIGGRNSLYGANRRLLIIIALLWLGGAPLIALILRRSRSGIQEIFFGLAAGGLAALEALLKGVAQAGAVENTFLPRSTGMWWLFWASFLGAAGAFGMIQWSYLRSCRASMMGSMYNVTYVALPLFLTALLVEGSGPGFWKISGLVLLFIGVLRIAGPYRTSPSSRTISSRR